MVVARLLSAGAQLPVMPLLDVGGNAASGVPAQIGFTAVNVGVVLLLTVMVKVVVVAHCPASGVNVYVVVARLSNVGDQLPAMPLLDVLGNADNGVPEQIGFTAVNVGTVVLLTVMVIVVLVAHCPAFGVNVYVVVARLLSSGDQLPVMPLLEVVGNADKGFPEQMGVTAVKVGTTLLFTTIVSVVVAAHCPTVGVNV